MKETKEQGITLLALIITIIVLVILAAVTINAAFSNRIIDTAVNGALNYADAQNKEKVTFDELDGSIQNIVNKLRDYGGRGEDRPSNHAPIVGDVTVVRVDSSTSELRITATAQDEDKGDKLTYTLLRGILENDTNPTELAIEPEKIEGREVTFKDTGLEMAQTYYYKIKVSDGIESNISINYESERTYCEGKYCEGGWYSYTTCDLCNGNKVVTCLTCEGKGYKTIVRND